MNAKRQNDKTSHQYDQLSEEYKPKQELGLRLIYNQKHISFDGLLQPPMVYVHLN